MEENKINTFENPWMKASIFLIIIFLGYVSYQSLYSEKPIKITEGIEIMKSDLCHFYQVYGNRDFSLCNLDNSKCINMKLLKDPCKEVENVRN